MSAAPIVPSINDEFHIIKEGKAEILAPKDDKVFYNPIQQFNRDLSIMAINSFNDIRNLRWEEKQKLKAKRDTSSQSSTLQSSTSQLSTSQSCTPHPNGPPSKKSKLDAGGPGKLRILEALSATGLRAIRYGHELNNVSQIVANDLLPDAVASIDRSIAHNKLQHCVSLHQGDAIKYMAQLTEPAQRFHVIDLDPYGTAAPFIDSAIQAIDNDGLLLVTCTDAAVLAGSGYPEKCFLLYGGNNFGNSHVNSETNHEAGIRLILHMLSTTAAKYLKAIEPVLSLSIDFYFRVFVRVKTSPLQVKFLGASTMLVYGCQGCGHKITQPLGRATASERGTGHKFQYPRLVQEFPTGPHCRFCGSGYTVAGPMWLGPLHNEEFVDKILENVSICDKTVYATSERIKGMLALAKSEMGVSTPFYFNLNHVCLVFKSPPLSINDAARALGSKGYSVSLTHAKPNCIKTDAPWEHVLRVNWLWLVKSNMAYVKMCEEKSGDEPLSDRIAAKVESLRQNIGSSPTLSQTSPGHFILQGYASEPAPTAEDLEVFTIDNEISKRVDRLRKVKLVRYQENPTKNWGPKLRPKQS